MQLADEFLAAAEMTRYLSPLRIMGETGSWGEKYCALGRLGGDWYPMVAAPPERGAMRVSADRTVLCRCGHHRAAHQHYRKGSECVLCDCPRWSPPSFVDRLFRRQQR